MTNTPIPPTERDPSGSAPSAAGTKLDAGKPDILGLVLAYFPRALEAVGTVSLGGLEKYTPAGWRTVPHGRARYTGAMGRHIRKELGGETHDTSDKYMTRNGVRHDAQIAWNALARLELALMEEQGVDPATERMPKWLEDFYLAHKERVNVGD